MLSGIIASFKIASVPISSTTISPQSFLKSSEDFSKKNQILTVDNGTFFSPNSTIQVSPC
jgi:hypothetical protein